MTAPGPVLPLGEVVAWRCSGTTQAGLVAALDAAGLNPSIARELAPRNAFSRACRKLEERVGGTAQVQYVWSPVYVDAQVLRDRDTDANGSLDERLWVQQDANWNVTALVNGSGVVQERYAYDAYGAVTIYISAYIARGSSSHAQAYLFNGLHRDDITDLDGANNRWYSSVLSRWSCVDPILYQGMDENLYRFVSNNPFEYTDPTGLSKVHIRYKPIGSIPVPFGSPIKIYHAYIVVTDDNGKNPYIFRAGPYKNIGNLSGGSSGSSSNP